MLLSKHVLKLFENDNNIPVANAGLGSNYRKYQRSPFANMYKQTMKLLQSKKYRIPQTQRDIVIPFIFAGVKCSRF